MCVLCGKKVFPSRTITILNGAMWQGGALKPTFDGKFFAHLSCVIWIPEAHVVNTSTMSPVEIRHIPKERLKLKCQICKQKDAPFDAPVQCYESSCSRNFHVGCARASGEGYYIAISENAEPQAFCPRHVPEEFKKLQPKRKRNRSSSSRIRSGTSSQDSASKKVAIELNPEIMEFERKLKEVEDDRKKEQKKLDLILEQRNRKWAEQRSQEQQRLLLASSYKYLASQKPLVGAANPYPVGGISGALPPTQQNLTGMVATGSMYPNNAGNLFCL